MSAILNTLKKLEEEKSVFEQNLDVQDLALHNEFGSTSSFVQVSQKRSNLIVTASIIIFLIIAVSLFFYFKSTQSQVIQKPASNSFFDSPKASDLNEVKLPKGALVSGISMNQISGSRGENMEREPIPAKLPQANSAVLKKTKIDEVSNQAKVAEVVKLIGSREGGGNSSTQILTSNVSSPDSEERVLNRNQDSQEKVIPSIIQNEISISKEDIQKTNKEFLGRIGEMQIDKVEERVASKLPRLNSLNLPPLKLKGIIYFTEGNPANYIFVSSSEQNNVKLKIGESIMGAVLQSIQSSRAIFTKNGETGSIEMGQ